jgi:hypothetical protein
MINSIQARMTRCGWLVGSNPNALSLIMCDRVAFTPSNCVIPPTNKVTGFYIAQVHFISWVLVECPHEKVIGRRGFRYALPLTAPLRMTP